LSSMGTVGAFLKGRACSDTLFHVLNRVFDEPMKTEERAAMPLAGGIMQHGYQCGMIWGATLAAGAQAYRIYGPGSLAETRAVVAAQGVVAAFRTHHKTINCYEITQLDKSSTHLQMINHFIVKGGVIGCFRMAAKYAPAAYAAINAALAGTPGRTPSPPASCAALLAKTMGASPMHAVMAAGLAGGIGLCGGGCGALGAAIWITGMNSINDGSGRIEVNNPAAAGVIDRFMTCTGYAFECADIVGRRFADEDDHADYLRDGGCATLIEALAAL